MVNIVVDPGAAGPTVGAIPPVSLPYRVMEPENSVSKPQMSDSLGPTQNSFPMIFSFKMNSTHIIAKQAEKSKSQLPWCCTDL